MTEGSSTVGGVFFAGDSPNEIDSALQGSAALKTAVDALERLPGPLANTAISRVSAVVAPLLEMNLVDVLVAGWKKHAALVGAARTSLETPGSEVPVSLATHRITSTQEPSVQLEVDGLDAGSVDLRIELNAIIHGLVGVVSAGGLTSLQIGRVELKGTLLCEGIEIKSVSRDIDPELELHLGSGIPLADYIRIPEPPVPRIRR